MLERRNLQTHAILSSIGIHADIYFGLLYQRFEFSVPNACLISRASTRLIVPLQSSSVSALYASDDRQALCSTSFLMFSMCVPEKAASTG
jgi:hypothetical protein